MDRPLLCLDTSIPTGSVALVDSSGRAETRTRADRASQAEKLFGTLSELLSGSGITPRELGGVAVASGPGSFTGLRIAASTAKTLAWTAGCPLYAAGSLLSLSMKGGMEQALPVCATFDAGREELYAACYRWESEAEYTELLPPCALPPGELVDALENLPGGKKRFAICGQGFRRRQAELLEAGGGLFQPLEETCDQPDAASLGRLVLAGGDRYLVGDITGFEPVYLRTGQAGLRLGQ